MVEGSGASSRCMTSPPIDREGITELLRRAQGDDEAWSSICARCGARMQAWCRGVLGDTGLAEDALHDALLRVRACAASFADRNGHGDAAALAWLRSVAVTSALAMARRRAAAPRIADGGVAVDDPGERLALSEAVEIVDRELAAMATELALPVILHDRQGLDYPALAARFGWTVNHARVRVHRGRAALRRRLERLGLGAALLALPAALSGGDGPAPGHRWTRDASAGLAAAATLLAAGWVALVDEVHRTTPAAPDARPLARSTPTPRSASASSRVDAARAENVTYAAYLTSDSDSGRAWLVSDGRWWPLRAFPAHLLSGGAIAGTLDAATADEAARWIDASAADAAPPVLGTVQATHGASPPLFHRVEAAASAAFARRLRLPADRSVQISIEWGPGGQPPCRHFELVRGDRVIAIVDADSLRESSVRRDEPGVTWSQDADAVVLVTGELPLPGDHVRAARPAPVGAG